MTFGSSGGGSSTEGTWRRRPRSSGPYPTGCSTSCRRNQVRSRRTFAENVAAAAAAVISASGGDAVLGGDIATALEP